jgi:hypothetical protein
MPDNCRGRLKDALTQNQAASSSLISYLHDNQHQVIAVLKNDRRAGGKP